MNQLKKLTLTALLAISVFVLNTAQAEIQQNTPEVWISGPDSALAPGAEFQLIFNIGNLADQVQDFFGISFEIRYSSREFLEFVQPFEMMQRNFLLPDVYTFIRNEDEGVIHVAISRKRGAPGRNGHGELFSLPFRIVDGAPENWRSCFAITNIFANDPDGNPITINPGDAFCISIREPNLDVIPNPFTPNGDGHNDDLIFDREGGIPDHWIILIMDRTGRIIRTLRNGQDRWDGKDDQARPVLPGAYLYVIRNNNEIVRRGLLGIIR